LYWYVARLETRAFFRSPITVFPAVYDGFVISFVVDFFIGYRNVRTHGKKSHVSDFGVHAFHAGPLDIQALEMCANYARRIEYTYIFLPIIRWLWSTIRLSIKFYNFIDGWKKRKFILCCLVWNLLNGIIECAHSTCSGKFGSNIEYRILRQMYVNNREKKTVFPFLCVSHDFNSSRSVLSRSPIKDLASTQSLHFASLGSLRQMRLSKINDVQIPRFCERCKGKMLIPS